MPDPEKERLRRAKNARSYYQRNPEKCRAAARKRYQNNKQANQASARLRDTGWSDSDVRRALLDQSGRCVICGVTFDMTSSRSGTSMVADHDHGTGAKRALLCRRCNVLEGMHLKLSVDEEEWGRRIKAYRAKYVVSGKTL